jgi:uncharacterized membrane protein YhdT
MEPASEDPVVTSSRREAAFALGLWTLALAYTVGYCYLFGYNRSPEDLRFILGIPDWVLWGILAPWLACTLISSLFARYMMQDAHLEEEESSSDLPAGPPAAGEAGHG